MGKLISLEEAKRYSSLQKKKGLSVGLLTGAFDILHMGHVNLFRFAKKYVDLLIVGLDNDTTIKISKGDTRPINNFKRRSEFLNEIISVDRVFKLDKIFKMGDVSSYEYMTDLYKQIMPTHIFTSVKCDSFYQEKKKFAKSLGIKFIPERTEVTHTTNILKVLESEL